VTVDPSGSSEAPAGGQDGAQLRQEPRHQRPRWLILLAVVVAIAVLALVLVMMLSGGEHGPGRHEAGAGSDQGLEGTSR